MWYLLQYGARGGFSSLFPISRAVPAIEAVGRSESALQTGRNGHNARTRTLLALTLCYPLRLGSRLDTALLAKKPGPLTLTFVLPPHSHAPYSAAIHC